MADLAPDLRAVTCADKAGAVDETAALHRRLIVIDGHLDVDGDFGRGDHGADVEGSGQFDLPKAARSGLSGACLCISGGLVRSTAAGIARGWQAQERGYSAVADMLDRHADRVALATDPASFRRNAAEGRFSVVLALQNAAPFGNSVGPIAEWWERGVRMMALTFIGNNAFGDSSRPYPFAGRYLNGGLTGLGREAVQLMNELGIMVDVSQLSDESLRDVMAISRAPVVASHSAPRGFLPTRRNLTDDDMRAIADAGGLVNVVGFANYLRATEADVQEELRSVWLRHGLRGCRTTEDAIFHADTADWDDERFGRMMHEFHDVLDLGNPHASVDDLAEAVAYTVDIVGIDHVGLASDFNHGGGLIGWRNAGEAMNVTAALSRRGFDEPALAKLWGENFLSFWARVASASRPAAAPTSVNYEQEAGTL